MGKTKQQTAREIIELHDAAENSTAAEAMRLEMQAANLQAALLTGNSTATRSLWNWRGTNNGN